MVYRKERVIPMDQLGNLHASLSRVAAVADACASERFRAPAFDPTAGLRTLEMAVASTMATVARVETMVGDVCRLQSVVDDTLRLETMMRGVGEVVDEYKSAAACVETMARDLRGVRSALDEFRFAFPARDRFRSLADEFAFPERALGLLPSDTPEQPDVNALAEVPTSDTTTLSYEARPGDQMNLINGGAKAIRLKVVTACGTATIYDLHPGGEVQLTVGTSPASVYLLNVDDDYTGLRIVR
jgi:hypothetical protein